MIDKHEMIFFRDQIHRVIIFLTREFNYAEGISLLQNVELSMTEKIKENNRKK